MNVQQLFPIEKRLNDQVDFLIEANHRVANSFAAVAAIVRLHARDEGQIRKLRSPKEVRDLLEDIAVRIETAAHMHRALTRTGPSADIDVAVHLRSIAEGLLGSCTVDPGEMIDRLDAHCAMPSAQALAVAMIVTELITNSIKYAHPAGLPGRRELGCQRTEDGLLIYFADDGVGLPEGLDPQTAASLGFRIIRSLAGQIGAELRFLEPGIGVRAELLIPVETTTG